MARRAFAWLAAAVFSAANAPAYAGTRVVKTRSGPVRGKVHGSGISSFIGVPFAASTGGAGRRLLKPVYLDTVCTTRNPLADVDVTTGIGMDLRWGVC